MARTTVCTNASHDAAKSSDSAWSSLLPIGIQQVSACSYRGMEMPGYRLSLSNCPTCDSTLARPLTPADAEAQAKAEALWEEALAGEGAAA